MDTLDIALRLCAATLVGFVLGLNRDLHGKPTGVRTLGILCLGSAVAVLSIQAVTGTDASRVIQGIVTGVGFLGAGVIVRSEKGHHVQGLTAAACVWVTACMGAARAVAQWQIVVIGVARLGDSRIGGPFEKAIDRRWPSRQTQIAGVSTLTQRANVRWQPSSSCCPIEQRYWRGVRIVGASISLTACSASHWESRSAISGSPLDAVRHNPVDR